MYFSFSSEPYFAIIGDLKNSKKIDDRKQVQETLKNILGKINMEYAQDVSAKFTITLGDEFQGLLCEGKNILTIVEEIQKEMYPIEIRFGIGVGAISTKINPELAIGADGPCYYRARNAIEFLKKNEKKNKTYSSKIRIEIDEEKETITEMLNTILSLCAVIKSRWTDRQREIIWDFEHYQDGQEKCAERLGIAQSSVQRGLTNGNYYAYKEAMNTLGNVMKQIRREDV